MPCRVNPDDRADRIQIAEQLGDVITGDHKVLNEDQVSRLHHNYPLVVQGDAMDSKLSLQNQSSSRDAEKSQTPEENPRSTYTDNSLGFADVCEELNWNHERSTPYRSETNEIAERAERRVKEGTWHFVSLDCKKAGGQKPWSVTAISEMCKTCWQMARHFRIVGSIHHFEGPNIPFGSEVTIDPISSKDRSRVHQFGIKVFSCNIRWICFERGEGGVGL